MTDRQKKTLLLEIISEGCQSLTLEELAEVHDLILAIEAKHDTN